MRTRVSAGHAARDLARYAWAPARHNQAPLWGAGGLAFGRRFAATPAGPASGDGTDGVDRRSAAPSDDEIRKHGRALPKPRPTMAELAAEWQEKHGGTKEAENFQNADMQQGRSFGGGAAGSASEGLDQPMSIFQRFSRTEDKMDTMEQFHFELHAGKDTEVTVSKMMGVDGGFNADKSSSSQMEKAQIDKTTEGRMAHMYAGPNSAAKPPRPLGVMQLPQAPEGTVPAAERKEFLDRAGANPYDIYHGDQIARKTQGHGEGAPHKMERLMDMQGKQSDEMKSFLSHLKLQAGVLGPLAPVARHTLDPHENTYAAIRNAGLPLHGDPKQSPIAYVLSDWDWSDRKESVATANMYRSGPTILAAVSCAVFYAFYDFQVRNDWWDRYYDEYLGLDISRVDGMQNVGIFALTAVLINLFLMHPMAIGTVTAIRLFRLKRNRPLGPP